MNALLIAAALLLASPPSPPSPDTSAILRVIGRFGVAHACPIAADVALTAAHVIDVAPLDAKVPLWPFRYEGGGGVGVLGSEGVLLEADLGLMRPRRPFTRWYPRAAMAPAVGERLWLLAFDWSKRKLLFADEVVSGKVVRVVAGSIVIDEEVPQGASGSCVLNAAGEVVAVVIWSWPSEDGKQSGVLAAVFGEWWEEAWARPRQGGQ